MQIFNIITNIFTIIGATIGVFMFYFTFKNHQWLVEDRKKQMEQETINKLNTIFSIVAECCMANSGLNKSCLPHNIICNISNYSIPDDVVKFIDGDIKTEIERARFSMVWTLNVENIIKQYRNGTRLHRADFNKLRSFFKNNGEIDLIYNKISNK